MYSKLIQHGPLDLSAMSPHDVNALLAQAGMLQSAAQSGKTQPLLRGKKLGLLCETDDDDEAALFRRAAVELGAHVAHVRPHLSQQSTQREVQNMAQVLGRLYDAVECQGLAPELVRQVGDSAGVPVYDGIAAPDHALAGLSRQLAGDAPPADKQRYVLQAVLLRTIP